MKPFESDLPIALIFEEFFKTERERDERDEAADAETVKDSTS